MNILDSTRHRSRRRPAKYARNSEKQLAASLNTEPASLEDILITHKLRSRRRRKASAHQENLALHHLARTMASSPHVLLDTLLAMGLDLCSAGTAGLSILEKPSQENQVFRWTNLAGTLNKYVGGSTPANFSPCGVTLDRNAPQLFSYPARYFKYLAEVDVPIVEALVIPIYLAGERPGTIWILSHDDELKFDSEDARIMTALAEFTASGLLLTRAYESERQAREQANAEIAAHKTTEEVLRQAHSTLENVVTARTGQLQQLSAMLIALQDEERRRIARELHDSVGQYLAGIQMNLSALVRDSDALPATHKNRISDSMDMTERCMTEIRTISYLLHPPLLDEMGLCSALSWYVEGFAERSGIQVQLEVPPELGKLSSDIENAMFRVVQQSLANIHRHSGSKTAKVLIELQPDRVTLEVCDDGPGIPPETLKGLYSGSRLVGVGIAGMRERIRDLGGEFDIRSSEKGTTIAVTLPRQAQTKRATA